MLRVGFIGLGAISHENVLGYLNSPLAEIVAVCDISTENADAWLDRYGLTHARAYSDYVEMLRRENLDIVEILTPHHLHCEQAIECARAQVKGISLQKLMGITLDECQRIIDACKANSVVLKVYENFVFYPVYQRAKQLIKEGLIGELLSLRIHTITGIAANSPMPWCFDPQSWRGNLQSAGTGPLVGDDGFHKFSLARWFMERDMVQVGAWIDPETPLDAPAFIRARFRRLPGDSPKYAQIDFSFLPRMAFPNDFWLDDFIEIIGDRGIMWVNQCSAAGDRSMFRGNRMHESRVFPPIAVYLDGQVTTYLEELSLPERNWSTSFVASTRHFIQVIQEGGVPIYTGEEGMEITRYIFAAYLSAQEKRDVDVDEITVSAEAAGTFKIKTNFCNM